MNLIFFLLSFLDILGGILYIFSINFPIFYLIFIAKGLWSVSSCIIAKDYFYTIFGIIDIVCGLFGFLGIFNLKVVGFVLFLKGIYSIIFSF